jgi:hypothetical protein
MSDFITGMVLVILGACLGGIIVLNIIQLNHNKSEMAICDSLDGVLVTVPGGTACVSKKVIIGR